MVERAQQTTATSANLTEMTRNTSMPPETVRLLSKPEVCDRVGRTFPTIWQWMREGRFPRARDLGGRPAWLESEVNEWIASLPVRKLKGD
jgi:predicted DNA-binding transcriptional regulator AlpA